MILASQIMKGSPKMCPRQVQDCKKLTSASQTKFEGCIMWVTDQVFPLCFMAPAQTILVSNQRGKTRICILQYSIQTLLVTYHFYLHCVRVRDWFLFIKPEWQKQKSVLKLAYCECWGVFLFHWLAIYCVDIFLCGGVTCLKIFKRPQLTLIFWDNPSFLNE